MYIRNIGVNINRLSLFITQTMSFLLLVIGCTNNFDDCSGVSFLPYSDHSYQQAPYEAIDEATYKELKKASPSSIEWDITENSDVTEGAQTLACTGGACEI